MVNQIVLYVNFSPQTSDSQLVEFILFYFVYLLFAMLNYLYLSFVMCIVRVCFFQFCFYLLLLPFYHIMVYEDDR